MVHAVNTGFENAKGIGVIRIVFFAIGGHGYQEHCGLSDVLAHLGQREVIKGRTVMEPVAEFDESGFRTALNIAKIDRQLRIVQTRALGQALDELQHFPAQAVDLHQILTTAGQPVGTVLQYIVKQRGPQALHRHQSIADKRGADL